MKTSIVLQLIFSGIATCYWADNRHPDTYLNITDLVTKYGYPIETHEVTTEDGYILDIYRIPSGRHSTEVNGKPVLLMHGLISQAEHFVTVISLNCSTANILADHGYDVWLGNTRGTNHGLRHVKLNPKNNEFWNFSFHELGLYDLSATVDHILKKTGEEKLYYVCHSQGCANFCVLNSLRPEYQKKFRAASFLAPAVSMKYFNNSLLMPLVKQLKRLERLAKAANLFQLPPPGMNIDEIGEAMCFNSSLFESLCRNAIINIISMDPDEFDMSLVPFLIRHVSRASVKQLFHFAQLIASGHFRHYDYGEKKNIKIYGSIEPPDYPIKNINIPIGIFYSFADIMVSAKDMEALCGELPNCIGKYTMPSKKYSHIDFVTSKNLNRDVNEPTMKIFERY